MAKKAVKRSKRLTPNQKAGLVEAALVNEGPLEFVFKLEGNLRGMSVFELAPTLQSMGVALSESNRALFPQSTDLRVAVKPIEDGSYEIHCVLSDRRETLPVLAMAATWGRVFSAGSRRC